MYCRQYVKVVFNLRVSEEATNAHGERNITP